MKCSPYFQFWPNDWLGSQKVAMMTPEEEGAYIRLLALCWNDPDCSLPDDDEILARLSRLNERWLKGGSTMLRKCFVKHPKKQGFLTNEKLQKERERQEFWRKKSAEGGRKSGKIRGKKRGGNRTNHRSTTLEPKPKLPLPLPLPLPLSVAGADAKQQISPPGPPGGANDVGSFHQHPSPEDNGFDSAIRMLEQYARFERAFAGGKQILQTVRGFVKRMEHEGSTAEEIKQEGKRLMDVAIPGMKIWDVLQAPEAKKKRTRCEEVRDRVMEEQNQKERRDVQNPE